MLKIHQEKAAIGYSLLRPEGELDAFTVAPFRRAMADMAGTGWLVIDLSGVVFVDSAGLGALISGIRRIRERGGEVVVACGRPGLSRVLESTGLNSVVAVTASVEEAQRFAGLTGELHYARRSGSN